MAISKVVLLIFCLSLLTTGVTGRSLSQEKNFLQKTFYGPAERIYNPGIFPCNIENCVVGVSVNFQPQVITGFDLETGKLSLTGRMRLSWFDENVAVNMVASDHNNVTEIFLPEDYMWLPPITVYNTIKDFVMISDPTHKVRVIPVSADPKSQVEWTTTLVTDIPCKVNAKLYPFDQQECEIIFTAWNYNETEIYLYTEESTMSDGRYQLNEEWTLIPGNASNYTENGNSYMKYEFSVKRKYLWFLISMVAPIILLSMITAFVNMIPIDSGERMTFLLSIFLGLAFYMDMVQRTLPFTSNPMPFISYYLTGMVYLNSFAIIVNIFLMRIYNKGADSPVPVPVRCFIATLTWRWCCPKKVKPDPDSVQPIQTDITVPVETITLEPMERIDWRATGIALDILFFYVFTFTHMMVSVFFLVPLATGAIYSI